jgi:hypothetical protein
MNTYLIDKGQMNEDDIIRVASDCLQQKVKIISKIGRGANSKVYHVASTSQEYAAKFYFQHPSDPRDRLGVEFKSFSFLWEKGLQSIPQPIALCREHQCAFYGFIKGNPLKGDISQKDIDEAIDFLGILRNLTAKAPSSDFSGASEAFFSVKDIVNSIQSRIDRLDTKVSGQEYDQLCSYLNDEFIPLFKMVVRWSKDHLQENEISWDHSLSQEFRTLSPSDFGFHNALRRADGKIVFLDFEYFGWDDPAKLVSDFLWHPAMNMPEDLKTYFVQRMSAVFGKDPYFKARLKSVFPLFGLKWCLIFLNEFIPVDYQRREFASPHAKDKTGVRLEQLDKAKRMSKKIKALYKDFPYGS